MNKHTLEHGKINRVKLSAYKSVTLEKEEIEHVSLRIENLRQALVLHDQLYDALLKIENPKKTNLTQEMREKGKKEIEEVLIQIGTQLAGYDITQNGEKVMPEDLKTYIRKSMLLIDAELTKLIQTATGYDNIDMQKKMMIKIEDINKNLQHLSSFITSGNKSK